MANLEVGDIVLCTVERIEKTIVFVRLETGEQGSIIMSEIAPGRIRNIRNYVVPKKKIVCKILRISGDRIDLSLRRVSQKETKEVMDQVKQEKSFTSIIKTILKDKAEKIIEDIKKKERLYDFLEEIKEDPKPLEKLVGKKDSEKILEIVNTQKQKKAILKKEFSLKTTQPNGLALIKDLLGKVKDAEIRYISAGKYSIKLEAENIKQADTKLKEILSQISDKAKKNEIDFQIKEK